MNDEDGSDYDDQPPTGTGYDDGVPSTPSTPSYDDASQTWADDEVKAYLDRVLDEHREGEAAREERRREGADESPPRRRRFSQ